MLENETYLRGEEPDFSALEEESQEPVAAETEDSSVETKGEEETPLTTDDKSDEDNATADADAKPSDDEAGSKPEVDEFELIRQEFPELTKKKLLQMVERDRNAQKGITQKFQAIAEERKQLEEAKSKWQQNYELLNSDLGKLAVDIAKACQDPREEARLRQAYEQLTPSEQDVMKTYVDRQTAAIKAEVEAQKQELRAREQAMMQQTVQQIDSMITSAAEKSGVDPDFLFQKVDRIATRAAHNGEKITEKMLPQFIEQAAKEIQTQFEKMRQQAIEEYKKQKQTAAETLPPSQAGSAVPASSTIDEEPDVDDPDWAYKQSLKIFGRD
jgi:hypothetical protein